MDIVRIAAELGGARRSGKGWVARCPAHEDRMPSLSLHEEDGKILVHCFTGCSQESVVEALKARYLWPQPDADRVPWPLEKRRYGEVMRELDQARLWQAGAIRRLERLKKAALEKYMKTEDADPERQRWAEFSSKLHRITSVTINELLKEYERQRDFDPRRVDRIIADQKDNVAHAEEITWQIVEMLGLPDEPEPQPDPEAGEPKASGGIV